MEHKYTEKVLYTGSWCVLRRGSLVCARLPVPAMMMTMMFWGVFSCNGTPFSYIFLIFFPTAVVPFFLRFHICNKVLFYLLLFCVGVEEYRTVSNTFSMAIGGKDMHARTSCCDAPLFLYPQCTAVATTPLGGFLFISR